MKSETLRLASLALAVMVVVSIPRAALAQSYPSKPIRLIVPFPAGGGLDVVARIVGQKLTSSLGQPVVIDNRSGAGGTIGSDMVAKARPDGYTLLMAQAGVLAVSVSLFPNLPYDPAKDFTPLTLVAVQPLILLVHPKVPAQSVKELISLARSKPGQIKFAGGGTGGGIHLAGELFKMMAGVDIVYIPYKGGSAAMNDLLGGHVQIMFDNMAQAVPHVKAGSLRALAVTSTKRSVALPDLPTVEEAGVPGYEITTWYGMVAPAGTPKNIVTRLNTEIVTIMDMRDVRERFSSLGIDAKTTTSEQFAAFIKAEILKWGEVIRRGGIRAD